MSFTFDSRALHSTHHKYHQHLLSSMADPSYQPPKEENVPVFKINLSLPPSERYVALAEEYRDRLRGLRGLFDELITSISPKIPVKLVHWLAWAFLHRLYTKDETEEIRSIGRVTDIDIYLLVCLNTVLDLLMGCTSGGVRSKSSPDAPSKMLHFRTLDWTMDPLRDLIVQLEFYHDSEPDKVVATSITYVGFVGVLTGVRKDLSASLNFRPVHDTKKNLAFYLNHLLVLLGRRQSISSLLRECILPQSPDSKLAKLDDIVANVPSMPTTAVYLIFSDGSKTVTMEKDVNTAVVCSSESFIVATNHDYQPDAVPAEIVAQAKRGNHVGLSLVSPDAQFMADLIEDSVDRRCFMQRRWYKKVRKMQESVRASQESARKKSEEEDQHESLGSRTSQRLSEKREEEKAERERIAALDPSDESNVAVTRKELIFWLTAYPILNETTHYAVVMDPARGKPVWVKRYFVPETDGK